LVNHPPLKYGHESLNSLHRFLTKETNLSDINERNVI
jgi:hypothetical protein